MAIQRIKTSWRSLIWSVVGAVVTTASLAQTEPEAKLRNDPTYSIRNYKHPNKATTARGWESEIVLGRQARERRQVRMGDYKRTANVEPGRSTWVIAPRRNRATNPELVSGYNYKNPRPSKRADTREARKATKPILIESAEETPTGN